MLKGIPFWLLKFTLRIQKSFLIYSCHSFETFGIYFKTDGVKGSVNISFAWHFVAHS